MSGKNAPAKTAVTNKDEHMEQAMMTLRHQNFMWGVRREMGWPLFRPVNDCLAFVSGRPMDIEVGLETARVAQVMRKDLIYAGWPSTVAVEPDAFAVIIRELLQVDVIDRCFPWAADETSAIVLVSTRVDESFAIGRRGLLERRPGKPKGLGKGRKLAAKRIRAAAAAMGDELVANNIWLPHGEAWVEPDAPVETVVRFN